VSRRGCAIDLFFAFGLPDDRAQVNEWAFGIAFGFGEVVVREHFIAGQDGVRTFVLELDAKGPITGPPVICLHGLTRNHKDFEPVFPLVAELGRTCYALDVRGRGRSDRDPNPTNYNPLVYVRDLIGIMATLGVPRAVMLGTSMGGLMTMLLAALAPQMVAGAVLNDIGPEVDPAGIARIQSYVGATPQMQTWEQAGEAVARIGEAAFPGRDADFWIAFAKRTCVETKSGIVLDYDPAIAQFTGPIAKDGTPPPLPTMWDQFAALANCPTAVIRGALSDLLSADIVTRMVAAKPDLVSALVPNVGHAPLLSEPEAQEAIAAIIAQTRNQP
jgi:pimeloyl-ACP methyl ester carboxylesterase